MPSRSWPPCDRCSQISCKTCSDLLGTSRTPARTYRSPRWLAPVRRFVFQGFGSSLASNCKRTCCGWTSFAAYVSKARELPRLLNTSSTWQPPMAWRFRDLASRHSTPTSCRPRVRREQVWHKKTKWFVAAAAIAVAAGGVSFIRPLTESDALGERAPLIVEKSLDMAKSIQSSYQQAEREFASMVGADWAMSLLDRRDVWPWILSDAAKALAAAEPQPALVGDDLEATMGIDPEVRRLVELIDLRGELVLGDGDTAGGGQGRAPMGDGPPRLKISMSVDVTHDDPVRFVADHVVKWLKDQGNVELAGRPYRIVAASTDRGAMTSRIIAPDTPAGRGGGGLGGPAGGGGGGGLGLGGRGWWPRWSRWRWAWSRRWRRWSWWPRWWPTRRRRRWSRQWWWRQDR